MVNFYFISSFFFFLYLFFIFFVNLLLEDTKMQNSNWTHFYHFSVAIMYLIFNIKNIDYYNLTILQHF